MHVNKLLSLASICFLAGCAADSDVAQIGNLLFDYASGSQRKITRDQAAAVPYATMGLELGSSPQALFILGAVKSSELEWFAGEQAYVATNRGRIVRTAGLPYDLGGLHEFPANSASANAEAPGGAGSTLYSLDFPDLGIFGATARCSSKPAGDEIVEIFGGRIPTRHIVEHCEVRTLSWNFDNEFWEDRMSGYVWRSRQHIHPNSPAVILEVFRPEEPAPG